MKENDMRKEGQRKTVIEKVEKGAGMETMMEMKAGGRASCIQPLLWAYTGTALACILIMLTSFSLDVTHITTFPYGIIGTILRELSLIGGGGNVIAWSIYFGISLLPFGIWLFLKRKGKTIPMAWILPVFSVLLFGILYATINPAILYRITGISTAMMPGIMLLSYFSIVLNSFLMMCIVIGMIKRCGSDTIGQLIYKLKIFFCLVGLILTVMIFGGAFAEFYGMAKKAVLENTYWGVPKLETFLYLLEEFALNYLYLIFGLILTVLVIRLLEVMEREPYGEEVVNAAKRLAKYGSQFLMVMLFLNFLNGLIKLFTLSWNYEISLSLGIPLMYFGCSIILILISRNICENRKLKQEHDLFI